MAAGLVSIEEYGSSPVSADLDTLADEAERLFVRSLNAVRRMIVVHPTPVSRHSPMQSACGETGPTQEIFPAAAYLLCFGACLLCAYFWRAPICAAAPDCCCGARFVSGCSGSIRHCSCSPPVPTEGRSLLYLLRPLAFAIIIAATVRKNRKG